MWKGNEPLEYILYTFSYRYSVLLHQSTKINKENLGPDMNIFRKQLKCFSPDVALTSTIVNLHLQAAD